MRQVHAQEAPLLLDSADHHHRLPEAGLRVARRMSQGHKHFLVPQPRIPHVILHDRVAAREGMLRFQPVVNPPRRVSLLFRLRLVVLQNLVHDSQPGTQLRARHRLRPLIARRNRSECDYIRSGMGPSREIRARILFGEQIPHPRSPGILSFPSDVNRADSSAAIQEDESRHPERPVQRVVKIPGDVFPPRRGERKRQPVFFRVCLQCARPTHVQGDGHGAEPFGSQLGIQLLQGFRGHLTVRTDRGHEIDQNHLARHLMNSQRFASESTHLEHRSSLPIVHRRSGALLRGSRPGTDREQGSSKQTRRSECHLRPSRRTRGSAHPGGARENPIRGLWNSECARQLTPPAMATTLKP
jgi:hypothetical protein